MTKLCCLINAVDICIKCGYRECQPCQNVSNKNYKKMGFKKWPWTSSRTFRKGIICWTCAPGEKDWDGNVAEGRDYIDAEPN